MGIFQQFPYSNFHEMNLDQIIKIMREMQDEWENTKTEWASYKEFIDNYFANLDVSEEVLEAMRTFAADGTLNAILDDPIAEATTAWLAEHITPTTPAVDTSLSIAGAAADALVTGHLRSGSQAIFGTSYQEKIVYDIAAKTVAFPAGFCASNGHTRGTAAQTVTLPNDPYNAYSLHYDDVTNTFFAANFNSGYISSYGTVGVIYNERIHINGVAASNIVIKNSQRIWACEPYMMLSSNERYHYNSSTRILTLPVGFYIYQGVSGSFSGATIDLTQVPTTSNAWVIKATIASNGYNITPYAEAWNIARANNDPVLGWVYDDAAYIFGIAGAHDLSKFALYNAINYSGNVQNFAYYDYNTKIFKLQGNGFIVASTGKSIPVSSQSIDLSTIPTTEDAWDIIINDSGQLGAIRWRANPSEIDGYIIGSVYKNSFTLLGNIPAVSSKQVVKVFGDSVVAGTNAAIPFHTVLGYTDEVLFYNHGVGSSGYVATTQSQVIAGNGVVGVGSSTAQSGSNSVVDIINTVSSIPAAIIFAGTNDYSASISSAAFTSAVNSALDALLTKTNNILVITPLHREVETANSAGLTLTDYANIIKTCCTNKGVKCFDGFDIPINPASATQKTRLIPDGLHPNNTGHSMIAGAIRNAAEAALALL